MDMRRDVSCYHCGLPVPGGRRYEVTIDGSARAMCCPACQAVAEVITAGGFGQYYQYRTENSERPDATHEFAAFDTPDFQQSFVSAEKDGSSSVQLLIGGIHCAACVWLIEHYLRQLPGVSAVRVSLSEQQASICWQPAQLKLSQICSAIAAIGYTAQPFTHSRLEQLRDTEQRQALRRLGVAGIGMMQVGMFAIGLYAAGEDIAVEYHSLLRWVSLLLATVIVFYAARPFFGGAWRSLKTRSPGMDLPIAIAIGLAYIASVHATVTGGGEVYFDSVCMFTFFLLCGRYMEMRARHRSGRVTTDVLSLLPSTVLRALPDDSYAAIPATNIKNGDVLLVKSGQVIPADGCVMSGASDVNEAALTGEFMPVTKQSGDPVSAGAINGENPLTIRVEAIGKDMRISRIKQMLERAQDEKPKVEEMAQRISLWFVLVVLTIASLVWVFWHFTQAELALAITLSVLVVSCPCALSLATPTAITAATNALRQRGLLVTRRTVWEALPHIRHVIFDKTGTLTQGQLRVNAVDVVGGVDEQRCFAIAAALERGSSHPIARAFADYDTAGLQVSSLHSATGQGVQGVVAGELYRLGGVSYVAAITRVAATDSSQNVILLANRHGLVARFKLQDELRPDAAAMIKQLQTNNLNVHLLSGDASGAAADVAAQLGISHVVEGAQPQDKLAYVQKLQGEAQGKVMMVGDGINDIPVLAAADVSLAMLDASDLAKTSADCVLLTPSLVALPDLFTLARRTSNTIRQNLTWALLYNASAIPLAALGFVPPWMAAIGMSASSILVILNSLRLWPRRVQDQPSSHHQSVLPAQAGI